MFELEKEIYTVIYWLAQLFVTRSSLKVRHAAVTKFARAQTSYLSFKFIYFIFHFFLYKFTKLSTTH